jgi:hypothetical protein
MVRTVLTGLLGRRQKVPEEADLGFERGFPGEEDGNKTLSANDLAVRTAKYDEPNGELRVMGGAYSPALVSV